MSDALFSRPRGTVLKGTQRAIIDELMSMMDGENRQTCQSIIDSLLELG